MSGVICVWANFSDDNLDWYENEYIPQMRIKNSLISTLHAELTPSGFEGDPIGTLDSPWPLCTIYNAPDIEKATASVYDTDNHPTEEQLTGSLANARFDVRTYRLLRSWEGEDFDNDLTRVASVAVMEWRTSKEKEAEIMDYYTSVIGPMVADNPDTYRIRLLEVDNATVLQGLSYETTEKTSLKAYLSIVEFETEEWPWDLAFKLSEDKQWAEYFEAQKEVKWQIGTYLVKRIYTEEDKKGLALLEDSNTEQ